MTETGTTGTGSTETGTPRARLARRYLEVNGEHPMTEADDAYVDRHFAPLEPLCARHGRDPDEVRGHMLAGRLPLPGYLRSDGTEMVAPDLLELVDEAGGLAELPDWFRAHWTDREEGAEEYESYLSGQNVCLHRLHPVTMRRKAELVRGITEALGRPADGPSGRLPELSALHALVDELDALEPPFTTYDRLRFGGPVSRDTCIDAVRRDHPLG
ncbi:DUF6058 family natural product biosynthesis protein [Kitasatospora purpeofusca]|uniref:DUF6058 family natural product biosynthesis protein n=1 Tax=Kitasatospora purpeofusca TaxID=67352 RepID=UPI0022552FF3|nr:DUF6058 family natural product biosynthesis protein [Kitasatospora purpeofusca]MCX4756116.1 DUF6058 family natural product biosynthesis protein [Kitasatospora purpeofusca]WSR36049.1 DUF6058 family natural product biosynthesis protein [Kitasatospora purpeofusca]WSR44337.1 DUF6058 family natural product biosynthesis protein [Kitasatospora purpeofusca]